MHDSTPTAETKTSPWATRFFAIWTGQAFSLLGSSLAQFALVWWLTKTTGSATVLATATLVAILPQVLLGPFAGALVDRWNRRRVMIAADGLVALAAGLLAYLYWANAIQIWHIYAVMLIRSIGGAFHWPAMQASTSLMVPKQQLSRVAGLNQTLHGVMNIISPPAGALALSVFPMHSILAMDVFTALIAISPLLFVTIPQPPRQLADAQAVITPRLLWRDVREGLRFIYGWPGVFALLIMATVINFTLNPAFSLMPILVTKHFSGGALQLGWMNSAWGVGVVAGSLLLSVWGGFRRRILTTLSGLVGMGFGTLLIGLSPASAFGLAVASMFLAGFMNPITNGPVIAILQAVVPPEIQGRVMTVVGSVSAAMSPLGMAIAGPVADALGVRFWFVTGGIICALMGLIAFRVPAVLHIEDDRHTARPAAEATLVAGPLPAAGAAE
ncbi:MAG: MFS transporter [Chloroflexi bacterium]|nr:MFS transporter [Chloroflexota bacterium]